MTKDRSAAPSPPHPTIRVAWSGCTNGACAGFPYSTPTNRIPLRSEAIVDLPGHDGQPAIGLGLIPRRCAVASHIQEVLNLAAEVAAAQEGWRRTSNCSKYLGGSSEPNPIGPDDNPLVLCVCA